ncbi:hypothetical protein CHF27_012565 [Romboutsia maritimum]|uniref:Uncharacterized protein n=1 Tax=Romboutsia maritimum TaxID=2020948 RepID=A0A371IQ46_9FIRM|nr:hypothetical protein [Romboutsia maritimum]RDY22604.1 hypothetical protein CHF27_012565 [Romboutsia maritimum]
MNSYHDLTVGIVEFDDGTIGKVNPTDIEFISTTHNEYTYELEKSKEEKEVICKCVDKGMDVSGEYDIKSNMHCPNCNEVVGDYECGELYFKYCPECGQKLKYTEAEE